jgi:hypothetical protein
MSVMSSGKCPVCKRVLTPSALGMLCVHCGEIRGPLPTASAAAEGSGPIVSSTVSSPEQAASLSDLVALNTPLSPTPSPPPVTVSVEGQTVPAEAEASTVVSSAPRKRGRPRKNSLPVDQTTTMQEVPRPVPAAGLEAAAAAAPLVLASANPEIPEIPLPTPSIRRHADSLSIPVKRVTGPALPPLLATSSTLPSQVKTLDAAGERSDPPKHPRATTQAGRTASHRKKRRSLWPSVALAVLLLLSGVALGAWRLQQGYRGFLSRLTSSSSFRATGSLQFYGPDFLSAYDSKLGYSLAVDKTKQSGELQFGGQWAKRQIDGSAILTSGKLAAKITGPTAPVIRYKQTGFLTPLDPHWYVARADASLYDNVCENKQPAVGADPARLARLLAAAKPQTTMLSPWYWTGSSWAEYYAGRIDSGRVSDIIQELSRNLPAGCDLNTFGLTAGDARNLTLSYQLWTEPTGDRLVVLVEDKTLGSKLSLDSRLYDYGSGVQVSIPPTATNLNTIQQVFAAALGRDAARRRDIDTIAAALAAYNTRAGSFPATLTALVPRDLSVMPLDPKTTASYAYAPTNAAKGYLLSAQLEDTRTAIYVVRGEQ